MLLEVGQDQVDAQRALPGGGQHMLLHAQGVCRLLPSGGGGKGLHQEAAQKVHLQDIGAKGLLPRLLGMVQRPQKGDQVLIFLPQLHHAAGLQHPLVKVRLGGGDGMEGTEGHMEDIALIGAALPVLVAQGLM